MPLRVLIKGAEAREMAGELLRSGGVRGRAWPSDRGERDEDWLATIQWTVDIIGASGGIAGIVDSVLRWRDRLRERPTPPQSVALYVGDYSGSLDSLTEETLTDLLRSDPALDEPPLGASGTSPSS